MSNVYIPPFYFPFEENTNTVEAVFVCTNYVDCLICSLPLPTKLMKIGTQQIRIKSKLLVCTANILTADLSYHLGILKI